MTTSFTQLHPELHALLPHALHAACKTAHFAKGMQLFATGAIPASMFFIVRGEVVLERMGVSGRVTVVQRARHGFVGEASLQSANYHCDGKVVAASDITKIPAALVRVSLASDVAFSSRWVAMLNREVKRLRLQCERMSLGKVQDRLLHLLETEGTAGKYPLGVGVKSLAAELGVSHEALYRCIAAMVRDGHLVKEADHLVLGNTLGFSPNPVPCTPVPETPRAPRETAARGCRLAMPSPPADRRPAVVRRQG
jgi:CRP/FNR family transcriptional regulator, dissimilatory nitrate respiration regulator